jgi:iron complex transport system permease protein
MTRRDVAADDRARRKRAWLMIALLSVGVVVIYFMCVSVGSSTIPLERVWDSLLGHPQNWSDELVINKMRAPRVLAAAVVGAALSLGGMAMQALFRNPMASPSVIGISSGSSFGAALYIALGAGLWLSSWGTVLCSFIMALLTLILVYSLAYSRNGGTQTTMLLLAGMAISALFSGLTSMIEFFSDADTIQSIVFWMLGSFDGMTWDKDKVMIVPVIVGTILICLNLRELNLLTAGETKARNLGVNVPRVRMLLLLGSALLVAGTVAFCGVIGFVGLIIPHIFRTLVGPEHKRLAPICILGGAIFLMLIDTFARSAMPPYELPVGTVTSIIGAPFFIWILRSRKNRLWRT